MMGLSEQDRDWVKAMIQEAAGECLNACRDFARARVEGHARGCPNIARLKWLMLGLGIGLGVSAPGIARAVVTLVTGM
ncbi:MAG TPA: hypothetical protein VMY35_02730 [Phycisphaerae bacterium]|nr:hypothetical protein [Phycisphaerae bacterium]